MGHRPERGEEHERLADADGRLAGAEAVCARVRHGHEAIARERIRRGEARFHAPVFAGPQRGKPAGGAGEIAPQLEPRPARPAAADEVAFIGKGEIGRILGEQVEEREAGGHAERKRVVKNVVRLRALVAGEREDAVVRGPEGDLGIGDGRALRVEHADLRFDLAAGLRVGLRGCDGDLQAGHRIGHAQAARAVAAVRGFEFPRALIRPANEDHGDENVRRVAGLERDFQSGRIAGQLHAMGAQHALAALDTYPGLAGDRRLHEDACGVAGAVFRFVRDEVDLRRVPVIPRNRLAARDGEAGNRARRAARAVLRGEAHEVFAGGGGFEARRLAGRRAPVVALEEGHERFAVGGGEHGLPPLGVKGDGFARGLHAHGVELHADQFRAHRDGRGQRRAIRSHGYGAHDEILRGSQHLPAVFANAEIEVRGLAEKLAAFRDGLLILIRDLDGEIPAKAIAGDLRQLRRDGEGRGQLALAAEGQALAAFRPVTVKAERAES